MIVLQYVEMEYAKEQKNVMMEILVQETDVQTLALLKVDGVAILQVLTCVLKLVFLIVMEKNAEQTDVAEVVEAAQMLMEQLHVLQEYASLLVLLDTQTATGTE